MYNMKREFLARINVDDSSSGCVSNENVVAVEITLLLLILLLLLMLLMMVCIVIKHLQDRQPPLQWNFTLMSQNVMTQPDFRF